MTSRRMSREGEERGEFLLDGMVRGNSARESILAEGKARVQAMRFTGRRRGTHCTQLLLDEFLFLPVVVERGILSVVAGPMLPLEGKDLGEALEAGWWPTSPQDDGTFALIAWEVWRASRLDYSWRRNKKSLSKSS